MTTNPALAQPVQLYSAGSLKGAWLEMIQAFILSTEGQRILAKAGFDAPNLSQ